MFGGREGILLLAMSLVLVAATAHARHHDQTRAVLFGGEGDADNLLADRSGRLADFPEAQAQGEALARAQESSVRRAWDQRDRAMDVRSRRRAARAERDGTQATAHELETARDLSRAENDDARADRAENDALRDRERADWEQADAGAARANQGVALDKAEGDAHDAARAKGQEGRALVRKDMAQAEEQAAKTVEDRATQDQAKGAAEAEGLIKVRLSNFSLLNSSCWGIPLCVGNNSLRMI